MRIARCPTAQHVTLANQTNKAQHANTRSLVTMRIAAASGIIRLMHGIEIGRYSDCVL